MAKRITGIVKLQIPAGQANPAPPVGPALGQKGINIMQFCKEFNDKTKDQQGIIVPVVITVYQDRSFDFIKKEFRYNNHLILVRHLINLGKGAAMKTGGRVAWKLGADAVVIIDADGQHNPKYLPKFIKS